MTFILLFRLLVLAAAISQPEAAKQPAADPAKPPVVHPTPDEVRAVVPTDTKALDDLLVTIAESYRTYARVSDHSNWAPERCLAPPPSGVQSSASKDGDTHGRKRYFLYASDGGSYFLMGRLKTEMVGKSSHRVASTNDPWNNPVGQIVVKESFAPVEVDAGTFRKLTEAEENAGKSELPPEYARFGEKLFKTGDPAGLFIMVKLDPKAPGTDQGWVYATTSADGKTITSRGKIASCIGCHEQTDRDRLYGYKWSWPADEKHNPVPPTRDNVEADLKRREAAKAPK